MTQNTKSVNVKAEVTIADLIQTHLDCILIWNNNDHNDKMSKISEQVEMIRNIIKNEPSL